MNDNTALVKLAEATYSGALIKLATHIAELIDNLNTRLSLLEKAEPCSCRTAIEVETTLKAKNGTTRKAKKDEPGISVSKVQPKVLGKSKVNKM